MTINLETTTMPRQSRTTPIYPEHDPMPTDLDAELRAVYVELADALPGGRKRLGLHAHRVAKASVGSYTPRPSDLAMLVAAGGNAARIALTLTQIGDALMSADGSDPALTFAAVARETGEAVAAAAEHTIAPCPVTERRALKEVGEAVLVLTRFGRSVGSQRRQRAGRNTPRGRVEVMQ